MPSVSLKAHFDDETIRLDESYTLPKKAQLLVTVLPSDDGEDERTAWYTLSAQGLAKAYADDEPDYAE